MQDSLPGLAGDSLRRVADQVFAQPDYRWVDPVDLWEPVRRAFRATLDALSQLRDTNPWAYKLVVGALIAVLALIVGHALWVAARTIRGGTVVSPDEAAGPTIAVRDAAWYAREAEALARAARYPEAMQADFLRLMLELDARELTRFHPSKTPIEYARESGWSAAAGRELRALVATLYRYAFGRVPCDAAAWAAWRDRAQADRIARAH